MTDVRPTRAEGSLPSPEHGRMPTREAGELAHRVMAQIETVIDGKHDAVRTALTVLLAEGHLLIEDVPGVGKTVLARALAASVGGSVNRIQFTPDLLPSDVTGVAVYDQGERRFEFKSGPVFANIVIGDEINRASPKTQSALLECMEERQVTADGTTYELGRPFTVFATQNPVEMEGTYALPEAQRDRFTARLSLGYPDAEAEQAMLGRRDLRDPLSDVTAVVTRRQLIDMIDAARRIFVSAAVKAYVVDIARATRAHPDIRLGASPRATLQLVAAAKALALIDGNEFVLPDHIAALAEHVIAHRLVPASRAVAGNADPGAVATDAVRSIVETTAVPNPG